MQKGTISEYKVLTGDELIERYYLAVSLSKKGKKASAREIFKALDEVYPNSALLKDWLVKCGPGAVDQPTLTQMAGKGIHEVNHAIFVLLVAFIAVMFVLLVIALMYQGVKFVGRF